MDEVQKTNDEWKQELTPLQYHVTREKGTEPAFSGTYYNHKQAGVYSCIGCGKKLFSSEHKYDSGSGWPSFDRSIDSTSVEMHSDSSHGMQRTEVVCSTCDAHLGHVFDDGPKTTGKRFCINSCSLDFEPGE